MALKLRKPTGLVPYPFVLIEGPEKSGKTYSAAQLAASGKCGDVYWLDIGEADADRYGSMADYMVVDHDGTYGDILAQTKLLGELPHEKDGRPTLLIVDSLSNLWTMIIDRAQNTANGRGGKARITMDLWNQAKREWRAVVDELIRFQGIVIGTARGGEVVEVKGGRPTKQRVWSVEGHKSLPFDVDAWIRVSRDNPPLVIGCRSLKVKVRPGIDKPMAMRDFTMEKLTWEVLGVTDKAGKRALPDAPQEAMPSTGADEWHELDIALIAALKETGVDGTDLGKFQRYIAQKCEVDSFDETTIAHLRAALVKTEDDPAWPLECVQEMKPDRSQEEQEAWNAVNRKWRAIASKKGKAAMMKAHEGLKELCEVESFSDLTVDQIEASIERMKS